MPSYDEKYIAESIGLTIKQLRAYGAQLEKLPRLMPEFDRLRSLQVEPRKVFLGPGDATYRYKRDAAPVMIEGRPLRHLAAPELPKAN